jgi:hypothetical protein
LHSPILGCNSTISQTSINCIFNFTLNNWNRGSSVSIVTRQRAGRSGFH